jgi:E3 ubiquitin-protein ligase listerin
MCTRMDEQDLPVIFDTLKLFRVMKSFHKENDDFEDAWNRAIKNLYTSMMELLRSSRSRFFPSLVKGKGVDL